MDFTNLPGFDIDADLVPLHNTTTSPSLPPFPFPAPPTQNLDLPTPSNPKKVFFITNCGSLLGRTIAQTALEHGHRVAACAREKHLDDLTVRAPRPNELIITS